MTCLVSKQKNTSVEYCSIMGSEMSERVPLAGHQRQVHVNSLSHDKVVVTSTFGSLDSLGIPGGSQKRKRRVVRKNLCSLFEAVQGVNHDGTFQSYSTQVSRRNDVSQEASEDGTAMTNNSGVSELDVWNFSQGSGDSSYSCGPTNLDESSDTLAGQDCSTVPLMDLLVQTDRGRVVSLMEAKALLFSIAKDLFDIHASGSVHTRVSLTSILLKISDGTGRATLSAGQEATIVPRSNLMKMRAISDAPRNDVAYIAPENFHRGNDKYYGSLTDKGNMWSFGCIVYALLSGGDELFGDGVGVCGMDMLLLSSVDKQQTWMSWYIENKIKDVHVQEHLFTPLGLDKDAMDLIKKVLHVDPGQRLSAKAVLQHQWFDGVRECIPQSSAYDFVDVGRTDCHKASISKELEQPGALANYEFSPLHNSYIYIDPSIISPMHPYVLVGHFKKEIHFDSMGETFKGIGIFAVYDVPNHGTMMSAKPVRISPY